MIAYPNPVRIGEGTGIDELIYSGLMVVSYDSGVVALF